MRGIKKLSAAALAAVMTLTSCSLKRTIVQNSRREIDIPASISFSWWGSDIRNTYTLEGLRILEKDTDNKLDIKPYPYNFDGYKENIETLHQSGKECDVIQLSCTWLEELSPDGEGYYDLLELGDIIDLENFTDEQLDYCMIDGKLNGLPTSLNALTFYHNKKIYDDHGLETPKTWDDLFAAAEVLSPEGIYVLESHFYHYWAALIAHEEQLSGRSAFSDGFTAENVASMFEFYKRLRDEKVIPKEDYDKELFVSGGCASELLWVSDAEFYVQPVEENGGVIEIGESIKTDDAARSGWYVKANQVYVIKKTTENPEEAAKLLNFLVNDSRMAKLQGTEKGIPLSRSALEVLEGNDMLKGTSYEAGKLIEQNSEDYEQMPVEIEQTDRQQAFFEQFALYDSGEKTAGQAAEDFLSQWAFV